MLDMCYNMLAMCKNMFTAYLNSLSDFRLFRHFQTGFCQANIKNDIFTHLVGDCDLFSLILVTFLLLLWTLTPNNGISYITCNAFSHTYIHSISLFVVFQWDHSQWKLKADKVIYDHGVEVKRTINSCFDVLHRNFSHFIFSIFLKWNVFIHKFHASLFDIN